MSAHNTPGKKRLLSLSQCIFIGFLLIGSSHSLFSQINWQSTNGPEGGATWYIRDNDNFAFYPDAFNLYRTSDGEHWEKLPFENLWPIGASNGTIAALQGYGFGFSPGGFHFLVSKDNGTSWTEGSLPPTTYGTFTDIAVDTNGIYVPDGVAGYIFRTQDDGLTWDTITPPGMYCYDIWSFENKLYAEWYDKFWRLAPDDVTWEVVSPNFGQDNLYSMFIDGSIRLFSCENSLWGSNNGGQTWKKTPIPYHNSADRFVQIGNRVYKSAGSTDLMYTENGGQTWTAVPLADDFDMFDLGKANGQLLCPTYNKGVMRLDTANNVLVQANSGLTSASVTDLQGDTSNLWAACGNGVFAYNLAEKIWHLMPLPTPHYYYSSVLTNGSGLIAACEEYGNDLYFSTDNGVTWNTIDPFAAAGEWASGIESLQILGNNLLAYSSFNGAVFSTDLGQTWQLSADIALNPVWFDGKYYGINGSNRLSSSSDFGLTWQEANISLSYVDRLYATDDRLFVLGGEWWNTLQALYTSTDAVNWAFANDGLPDLESLFFNPNAKVGKIWHKNDKYFLGDGSVGLFVSLDTCKTWLPIAKTGVLELVDTTFYTGGFGGGVSQSGLPQNYGFRASGTVFKDDNNNGIQEAGEIVLPNIQVNIFEKNAWYPYWFTTTHEDGQFSIGATPGNSDSLRVKVHSDYVQQINPPAYFVNATNNTYNFGVHFTADITDAAVFGGLYGRPRPGFNVNTYINYSNKGTLPVSGSFSLKLNPNYQFVSATPAPTAIIGTDSLVWDYAELALFSKNVIHLNGLIPATAALGNTVKMHGYLSTSVQDANPVDNQFVICDTIVGSFDPNEKRVEPAKGLTAAEIATGKDLFYTIQFQNTGTFEATRVRITDHLDTALNLKTLQLVGASHPVTAFNLLPGGLLEVVFDNIALPDSNTNEAASHGFVTFSIQRNKVYYSNYKVENKAAIYFDFNEPVITNTVVTPLYTPVVAVSEPQNFASVPSLKISPNPATQFFTIRSEKEVKGSVQLSVVDAEGKVCIRQTVGDINNGVIISTERLNEGIHTIYITNGEGIMQGQVVVVKPH